MNIYVETNFVLELASMQEQHESCEKIIGLCEAGSATLVLPAFCIAESYETLIRRANRRTQIANALAGEQGCKMLFSFTNGYNYIQHRINTASTLHQAVEKIWARRPNKGLQRTALCAHEIGAILKPGFGLNALAIYWCTAAEAQAVRPTSEHAMGES